MRIMKNLSSLATSLLTQIMSAPLSVHVLNPTSQSGTVQTPPLHFSLSLWLRNPRQRLIAECKGF